MCLDKNLICVIEKQIICQVYQNKKIEGYSLFESIVTSWVKPLPAFSSKMLKKPLNFTQIIAPEKVWPSVEQNEIDIYCVLIRNEKYAWKLTCSTHGLYVFWKKTTQTCTFFQRIWHICNFMSTSLPRRIAQNSFFLDQTECILGFLMYHLFECHG
jgi:hypothetical protein